MATRHSIEAGRGHVSLAVDETALIRGLNSAQQRLQSWGRNLARIGGAALGLGAGIGSALAPAITQFADYEQALADLRAAANPTADQFARIRASIERLAATTGTSLPEVTAAYSELLKAGRSVEEVIGGLGGTAIRFARVSGMGMAETATVLVDALNVFASEGINASEAANIMNRAADASTISLRDVSGAFSTGGSVMAQFGQNMRDTATAIAILGQNGIKAEDAGTTLKTIMLRLATGSESAGAALQELGVNVRGANGEMLPMIDIITRLDAALAGRGGAERDRIMSDLAGSFGIRGLSTLLREGVTGWRAMQEAMDSSLTVEQKFAIMTDTLWGNLKRLFVGVQLVAVEIGSALAPALRGVQVIALPVLNLIAQLARENQTITQIIGGTAAALVVAGTALLALGGASYVGGIALGVLGSILSAVMTTTISLINLAIMPLVFALTVVRNGFYIGAAASVVWATATAVASAIVTAATLAWGAAYAATALTFAVASAVASAAFIVTVAALKLLWAGLVFVLSGQLACTVATWAITAATLAYKAVLAAVNIGLAVYNIGTWGAAAALAVYKAVTWLASVATTAYGTAMWYAATATAFATGGISILTTSLAILASIMIAVAGIALGIGIAAPFVMAGKAVYDLLRSISVFSAASRDIRTWVSGIGDSVTRVADSISLAAGHIADSFLDAWDTTASNFVEMAGVITDVANQSFGGIADALAVGEWQMAWEIMKTAALLAWEQIKRPIILTLFSWADLFTETFHSIWAAIREVFEEGWSFVRTGFLTVALQVARVWNGVTSTIAAAMDALNPSLSEADQTRRAEARINAAGRQERGLQEQINNAGANAAARIEELRTEEIIRQNEAFFAAMLRDAAVEAGDQAEVARLERELAGLNIGAMMARVAQEGDGFGGVGRLMPPDRPASEIAPMLARSIASGTFAAGVTFGMLGSTQESVAVQALRLAQEAARAREELINRIENDQRIQEHQLRQLEEINRVLPDLGERVA